MSGGAIRGGEQPALQREAAVSRGLSRARLITLIQVLVIAAIAFCLRVAWAQYSPAVPAPPRFDDSLFYFNMAQNIAELRGYVHPASGLPTAQWPPGYPTFLAGIFAVTGASVTAAEIANAVLGAVTATLVFALTLRLVASRTAAVAAGIIAGSTPSLVMIAGVVWSETLFTTLFVLAILLAVLIADANDSWRWPGIVALSAVTAAATLTREAGLVIIPIAITYWITSGGSVRRWYRPIAATMLLTTLLILPWSARNVRALDAPIFVSSSSAGNFWQGHHEPGRISEDLVQQYGPLSRAGGETDIARGMWSEGWDYATSHPWDELTAPFSKTWRLYQGDRAGLDLNDGYGYFPFMSQPARDRWGFASDAFYYGLLALALLGIATSSLRSPVVRIVAPCVGFWTLGHVLLFADPRFHLPLLPIFACGAGAGIAWLASRRLRSLRGRDLPGS